jgi:hypothetical protein
MQIKVSELADIALDWAVTTIEDPEATRFGVSDWRDQRKHVVKNGEYLYRWSSSWNQAGPIIERERINIDPDPDSAEWYAYYGEWHGAPTPLIAAMRCYVASKLGDEVNIPEELCA